MALTKLTTDLIDGSLGTDWQATPKTADFTAVAGEGYFVNTTSGGVTVTLPTSPTAGDEVSIVDYAGTADTNNITITSSDNINGASDDKVIDYERGGVSIVYVDATQGWIAYNAANETAEALVPESVAVDYLVVAGGGSGSSGYGGSPQAGGGAGGLRTSYGSTSGGGASAESSLSLAVGANYTVTVGAGGTGPGAGDLTIGTDGSDSVFSTITSTGGGAARSWGPAGGASNNGGSGGGASYDNMSPGSGTPNQGFAGGSPSVAGPGAGGGGAASGGSWNSTDMGVGGDGLNVSITGSSVGYAGGGGRVWTNVQGGGGVSASSAGNGGNGTANTGGGGGGGNANSGYGGNGGTGVVIIRYPNIKTITIGSGLTGTTATDGTDKVTTFTAGTGNISFS